MGVELLPSSEWPDNFWQQWDRLNRQHCNNHPMLQSRFVEPLARYFSSNGLTAAISTQGGEINGALLLQPSGRRAGTVRSAFLPSQAQIALIQTGSDPAGFLAGCLRALPRTTLRLDLLAVDSKYQRPLLGIPGIVSALRGVDMSISLTGSFETYWNDRPRKLKKNISRYQNRMSRDVGIATLVIRRGDETALAVDRYGFLESRGWKGAAGTALHPGNDQGQFYREVINSFSITDESTVYELWSGDQLYASRLCIHNEQQIITLKTTFDEEAKAFAPGRLLLYYMLEHLFATHDSAEVEFYTNASKEQLDWCTDYRETANLSVYRVAMARQLEEFVQRLGLNRMVGR